MTYYFSKTIALPFDAAVARVTAALKEAGFEIISDIDVRETFKRKLDIDFRNYRILGACNPALAHAALEREDKIGTMLPCNVVVQDAGNGRTEVAAVDPVASMMAVKNPRLAETAENVRARLKEVIDGL